MKRISAALALFTCLVLSASFVQAEPCLMAYPDGPSIYHYSSAEEYLVGPGHALYDPAYDRGGYVIIDANTHEIAEEIYQAPGLVGFELDEEQQGWFFQGSQMNLVIDGFSNVPTTYTNVSIAFRAISNWCGGTVLINGLPAMDAGDGTYYLPLGDLVVSTPTPNGNNFSDTMTVLVEWDSCLEIDVWAWSDDNYNGLRDGGDCRTAFSKNTTIPTEASSLSQIKATFE